MSKMTREEARKWIQYHINISDYEETDELYIALNMALKALSVPESGSRYVRIVEVESVIHNDLHALLEREQINQLTRDINGLNFITIPEGEKGEWILKCEFPRRWECSCCHTSSYEYLDRCPKCEADMRGNK